MIDIDHHAYVHEGRNIVFVGCGAVNTENLYFRAMDEGRPRDFDYFHMTTGMKNFIDDHYPEIIF